MLHPPPRHAGPCRGGRGRQQTGGAGHRCHGRSERAGPGWIHQPV